MGKIIPFNTDRHEQTLTLLPWYITGQLEPEEAALVEAHLDDCRECRAEFRLEQRLEAAVAGLPFDADLGWAQVRSRLAAQHDRRGLAGTFHRAFSPSARTWWAIAAQFVLVIVAIGMLLPLTQPARYHALGAARPAPRGDLIVMFRPEAQAQDLARAVRGSGARLVDGPTAADAYVLAAPAGEHDAALASLRADHAVVMAEPLDAAPPQ